MTKSFTTVSAIAAAALLAITLAACTQATPTAEPTSKPAVTETAAPTETPAAEPVALEGDLDGNGRVSEFEKQVMAQNATRDYTLADGTVVAVDPKAPLPAPVAEAVKTNAAGPASGLTVLDADTQSSSFAALRATLDADANATGRGIVLVYQGASYGEGILWNVAASGQKIAPFLGSTDKATTLAKAADWASARGFELVVI